MTTENKRANALFAYIGEVEDRFIAEAAARHIITSVQKSNHKRLVKYSAIAAGASGVAVGALFLLRKRRNAAA